MIYVHGTSPEYVYVQERKRVRQNNCFQVTRHSGIEFNRFSLDMTTFYMYRHRDI